MAVVGKKTSFGEVKYGYINTEGKLVIPLLYSIKPSEFSGGYAKVVPKDKSNLSMPLLTKRARSFSNKPRPMRTRTALLTTLPHME